MQGFRLIARGFQSQANGVKIEKRLGELGFTVKSPWIDGNIDPYGGYLVTEVADMEELDFDNPLDICDELQTVVGESPRIFLQYEELAVVEEGAVGNVPTVFKLQGLA